MRVRKAAWDMIGKEAIPELKTVFGGDPDRLSTFTLTKSGIHFDWSKTQLTQGLVDRFIDLANASNLAQAREALFQGETTNVTEGRAGEHKAERGDSNHESSDHAKALHNRLQACNHSVEPKAFRPVNTTLTRGIGRYTTGP